METNELKIILGNSIEEPEVDMDNKYENSDFPYQESATQDYLFSIIINNIGKKDFKENYLVVKNLIKEYSTKEQLRLSTFILNQIIDIYDFEFPGYLNPTNQEEINQLFEFLEFLEYDNEKFITEIWYYLNIDNVNNINDICNKKSDNIITEIEEQLQTQYFSKMITYFLRTYTKDKLIEWFCNKSSNIKTLILLTIRKEDNNDRKTSKNYN